MYFSLASLALLCTLVSASIHIMIFLFSILFFIFSSLFFLLFDVVCEYVCGSVCCVVCCVTFHNVSMFCFSLKKKNVKTCAFSLFSLPLFSLCSLIMARHHMQKTRENMSFISLSSFVFPVYLLICPSSLCCCCCC